MVKPFITNAEGRERERWDDPATRGNVECVRLLSGDVTPTSTFSSGIAEFAPHGGHLAPHRHSHPEIYHIIEGQGIVTVDGAPHTLKTGDTLFIPGDAEHGVVNNGATPFRLFYVFAADRFDEVTYKFPEARLELGGDGSSSDDPADDRASQQNC